MLSFIIKSKNVTSYGIMDMYTVQTDEFEYILVDLNSSPKVVVSLLYEGGKSVMERENKFDLIKGNVSHKGIHIFGL